MLFCVSFIGREHLFMKDEKAPRRAATKTRNDQLARLRASASVVDWVPPLQ